MFSYTFTKSYTLDKLVSEIAMAGIPMISMDLNSDTQFTINTAQQLDNSQQLKLNQVVAAHVAATDAVGAITAKIIAARTFGVHTIARYGAKNVLSGYDVATIQDIMIRTAKVQAALNSGSLYVAIQEINNIEPDDTIITVAKLKSVRNEIEDYLQIPRT